MTSEDKRKEEKRRRKKKIPLIKNIIIR